MEDNSIGNNYHTYGLLASICISRISTGFMVGIFGPTLLSLANNTSSNVAEVSFIFTSNNIGTLIGGAIVGYIGNKVPKLYSYGLVQILMAVSLVGIPFCNTLWLLLIVTFLLGVLYAYLDSGVQAMVLQIWGEEKSRPYIALYHLLNAVGALITPLIVRPFLRSSETEQQSCPQHSSSNHSSTNSTTINPSTTTASDTEDDVKYAYVICSAYSFLCGVLFIILAINKIESKVRYQLVEHVENREEEPLRQVFLLLVVIGLFFFLTVSESIYTNYAYSIAVCSDLHFTPSNAALLNTLFLVGYVSSRLVLILASNFMSPRSILGIGLLGGVLIFSVEVIWGQQIAWITWGFSLIYGFFTSLNYPVGVSWNSQYTNLSGRYTGVWAIGGSLGSILVLPLAGAIFEKDPFYVMYLNYATVLALFLVFIVTALLFHFKNKRLSIDSEENEPINDQ